MLRWMKHVVRRSVFWATTWISTFWACLGIKKIKTVVFSEVPDFTTTTGQNHQRILTLLVQDIKQVRLNTHPTCRISSLECIATMSNTSTRTIANETLLNYSIHRSSLARLPVVLSPWLPSRVLFVLSRPPS